ncbi:MAG TPA: aldehyde dehydrogenase family protein [Chloroflexota bacterium]|nr:aldehyde dehydrogenase family protein [Chloroflexota bacterium]
MAAVDAKQYRMVIDGRLVDSASGETMDVVNPATNDVIATVPRASRQDVDRAVAAARAAFEGSWSRVSASKRNRLLMKLSDLIRDRIDEIAALETLNSGKAISSSGAEILGALEDLEFYAGSGTKLMGETIPAPYGLLYYTVRQPLGVAGQIIPWNYPFLMAMWKIAPALAAGNTLVLKPASLTPLTALLLGELCLEAGIPAGTVNIISGPGASVGSYLAGHPDVAKVAFTGETATGRLILQLAAQTMKRVTLELGGKSPNVVFADADLDDAVNGSLFAIFYNSGQSCEARSRLFVQQDVYERFVDRFASAAERIKVGDPFDPEMQVGAIISRSQLESIEGYIRLGIEEGARLVAGGKRPDDPSLGRGNFLLPTVLADVANAMRVAQEEIFGPVAVIIPFKDEAEVIRMANESIYGLAGTVWTRDLGRAHRVAGAIETGVIGINTFATAMPGLPFGGFKQSGIGRERGLETLKQYTELKSVLVNTSPRPVNPWNL